MDERNWSGLRHTPHTLWLLQDDDDGVEGSFTTPWLGNEGVILKTVAAFTGAEDLAVVIVITAPVLRSGLLGVTTGGIVEIPVVAGLVTATTSSNWLEISSIN